MGAALAVSFAVAAVFANIYPFVSQGSTQALSALHLPIALWLIVGIAYTGGHWAGVNGRMNFVRFSGELFIYYVLMALGGGVLTFFTMTMFLAIGVNPGWFVGGWLLPCGAAGAVLVGSWLVEAKQSVIESMAPVLTRLFTPLFTIILLAFLATWAWTGSAIDIKREVLIAFDLLLALVVGLVLYAVSARDPHAPPDFFDRLQLLLIVSALAVDALALTAIAGRINEFGFTPNRVAALGENLILLVNLVWSAWLYFQFLRRDTPVRGVGSLANTLLARVLRLGRARRYRLSATVWVCVKAAGTGRSKGLRGRSSRTEAARAEQFIDQRDVPERGSDSSNSIAASSWRTRHICSCSVPSA
jgi:hypothetical protein